MIREEELRKGVLVKDKLGRILKVAGFRDEYVYLELSNGTKLRYLIRTVYPVDLTKEILVEWCGFKEIQKGFFKLKDWYIDLPGKIWKFKREYQDINFKYLHQLQNLYFDLTSQELKIKHNIYKYWK